jgi:fermentation-respiration switch protein FrsA (DUF1100 family)
VSIPAFLVVWGACLASLVLGGWALAVLSLALLQGRLIYRPDVGASTPEAAGTPWFRIIRDGDALLGWWAPPRDPDGLVLAVFHGNRGTLARMAAKTALWHQWGFGLFLGTYRGYEGKPGRPTEAGLIADGRACLDWLAAAQGVDGRNLVLYGESLGAAVALRLATERKARGLVMEAPFCSLIAMASERHPWAPVRWLLRHVYDNLSRIGGLRLPILILHGDADRTTPVDHSRKLAELAGSQCRLAVLPGGGHLDLYDKGAARLLTEFLSGI